MFSYISRVYALLLILYQNLISGFVRSVDTRKLLSLRHFKALDMQINVELARC